MQNITNIATLKFAIQGLEAEQADKGQLLKEQFYLTCENLKPVNLLKSSLNEMASSPNLINNILGTVIGLATGYLSRKIVIGSSGNIFRKLIGSVLQFGVTSLVAKHPDDIISLGQNIIQHIFRKKEMNSKQP
ncbi:MAG: hypothetical protein NTW49_05975 [Bacteroidia bacterium]|nr:hypothetical protein [Bacteroidia bacterium]